MEKKYKKVFTEHGGILRSSKAIELGVPKHILYQMAGAGELVREGEGIYRLSESAPLGNPDLVQIGLRVPRAVICLISALYFHELTTQIPGQVYFALPRNVKSPRIEYPPVKVFHFSEESYRSGVSEVSVDGIKIKVYDREKTIADCFKFREKIGMDIALEALRDYLNQPRPSVSDLMKFARVNRVDKIMRPYLESLA